MLLLEGYALANRPTITNNKKLTAERTKREEEIAAERAKREEERVARELNAMRERQTENFACD